VRLTHPSVGLSRRAAVAYAPDLELNDGPLESSISA
jgi:hypothetical protein